MSEGLMPCQGHHYCGCEPKKLFTIDYDEYCLLINQINDAAATIRGQTGQLDELQYMVDLMYRFGYIEDRFCGSCSKYRKTIGNECIECGRDT